MSIQVAKGEKQERGVRVTPVDRERLEEGMPENPPRKSLYPS